MCLAESPLSPFQPPPCWQKVSESWSSLHPPHPLLPLLRPSLCIMSMGCYAQCPEDAPAQGPGRLPGERQAFNRDTLLNSNQEKDSLLKPVSIYRTQLLKLKGSIRLKFNLLYTVIYRGEQGAVRTTVSAIRHDEQRLLLVKQKCRLRFPLYEY